MSFLSWIALSLGLAATPWARTTGYCPTREQLQSELVRVLPAEWTRSGKQVVVDVEGDVLRIRVEDARGELLYERQLQGRLTCAERARVAAVVVAVREQQLASSAPALPDVGVPSRPVDRPTAPALTVAVIGAVNAQVAERRWAPGARAGVVLHPRGTPWGVQLSLGGVGPRPTPLGDGSLVWFRLELGVGPAYRLDFGRWFVGFYADALVGGIWMRGLGFDQVSNSRGWDIGGQGGIRLGRSLGAFALWVEVSATGWFRRHQAQAVVEGVSAPLASTFLPRLDVALGVGGSWGVP